MPYKQRDKDFAIFSSSSTSSAKKKATNEVQHSEASPPELASSANMELILAEVKSVASRVNGMDGTVGSRLDSIDGALSEIKTSVSSFESSLSTLHNRVTDLEKRVEEAECRISATEDDGGKFNSSLTAMEKTVELLRSKIDDLETRSRRKNLKIVNLPEKIEVGVSLVDYLQKLIPKLVGLPADFPPLEIERAHRASAPNPAPNKPPRSILVRFLRYSQREAVLRAALKKRDILHEGSQLRFYPDLSAEVLRRRREFDTVGKVMVRRNMYRGFAYPARLRCLYEGRIHLFDTPESAAAFLQTID